MARFSISLDRVSRTLYSVAAVCLLVIVVLMVGRIASRNLSLGVGGLQIVAQLFEVWLAFLVVGSLAYERRHIEIDYFTQRIPDRWQPYHELFVTLVGLYAAWIILAGSVLAMGQFWDSTAPTIDIPIPLYYLAPVVGIGFLTVVLLARLVENVREVRG